jgi:hypothetical protein
VEDPSIFVDAEELSESRYNYGFGGNGSGKFYLGLTPYSKKKGGYNNNQELRFSLGTSFGARRIFNYYQVNNTRIDTFASVSNNNIVYADSSVYNRYLYAEEFYDISLGAAYLFKTDTERRFHFYTGVGFEVGFSIRSSVRLEQYTEESIIYYDPSNPPSDEEPDNFYFGFYDNEPAGTTQTFRTNMEGGLTFLRTYIPFGINFRIARKPQSFFNKVFLFSEVGPGLEFQFVANEGTYVNPYVGVAMLGFTYRW